MAHTDPTHRLEQLLSAHVRPLIAEFTALCERYTSGACSATELQAQLARPHLAPLIQALEQLSAADQAQLGLTVKRADTDVELTFAGRDQVTTGRDYMAAARDVIQFQVVLAGAASSVPASAAPRMLTSNHLSAVKTLLAISSWSYHTVMSCYCHCRPVSWPSVAFASNPQQALADVLGELWRMGSGTTAPLLAFVEYLALQADLPHEQREELRLWVGQTAQEIGWDDQTLDSLRDTVRTQAKPQSPSNPHLLVAIIPSPLDERQFQIRSWLWTDDYQVMLSSPDQLYPFTDVEHIVTDALTQLLCDVRGYGVLDDDLIIAFILPRSLWHDGIEQWKVYMEHYTMKRAIGRSYPVVLRSLERIQNRRLRPVRWPPRTVAWFHHASPAEDDLDDVIDQLEQICCLALAVAPSKKSSDADLLEYALAAGIGVALWPRDTMHQSGTIQQTCAARIEQHVAECDLPKQLRQLRGVNAAGKDIWRQMAVLWDDPTRQPDLNHTWQAPKEQP
ncbi:MAG: hypothetical protein HC837_04815 [Chloroflexaceae bacterium]|nr:hypothetical protein [Chloroflexaceae bacterium]